MAETFFRTTVNGATAIHKTRVEREGLNFFGRDQWNGTHSIRIYASAGTIVEFSARPLHGTAASANGDLSVSAVIGRALRACSRPQVPVFLGAKKSPLNRRRR